MNSLRLQTYILSLINLWLLWHVNVKAINNSKCKIHVLSFCYVLRSTGWLANFRPKFHALPVLYWLSLRIFPITDMITKRKNSWATNFAIFYSQHSDQRAFVLNKTVMQNSYFYRPEQMWNFSHTARQESAHHPRRT